MYAHILINPTDTRFNHLNIRYCTGSTLDGRMDDEKEIASIRAELSAILDHMYAPLEGQPGAPEERQRVEAAVQAMVPWLNKEDCRPADHQTVVLHCAIAHHRKPLPVRSAREARVARILDDLLEDAAWRADVEQEWADLKMMGVLIPDLMVESELRSNAAEELIHSWEVKCAPREKPLQPLIDVLDYVMGRKKIKALPEGMVKFLGYTYLTRSKAEKPVFLDLVKRAIMTGRMTDLQGMQKAFSGMDIEFNYTDLGTCMIRVLSGWLTTATADAKEKILAFEKAELKRTGDAQSCEMFMQALNAIMYFEDMGEAYDDQVVRVFYLELEALIAANGNMDPAALLSTPWTEVNSPATPTDDKAVAPVHTWSVGRLLEWIEGPISAESLNRPEILERQRAQRKAKREKAATRPPGAAAARALPASGHDSDSDSDSDSDDEAAADVDVNLVVDDALQATAAFLLADLDDLLALTTRLKIAPTRLEGCRRSREAMLRLTAPGGVANDNDTCGALATAEAAINALRREIKVVRGDELLRIRFNEAVADALSKETLALGKRHGGVIPCPMSMGSWGWVAENFHSRWLYSARTLTVNQQVVPLPSHQALAFYVTGSSQSNHAFDISVHLWQRRQDRKGPPSLDTRGLRLMNTEDWFDTYIPCAVLHVPLGK